MEAIILACLALSVFVIYWMIQMLRLTKQNRILNSMILKSVLKYADDKGVKIDINKIQKEVEDSL